MKKNNPLIDYGDTKHIQELLQKSFVLVEYIYSCVMQGKKIDQGVIVDRIVVFYDLFLKHGDYNQTHADQIAGTQGISQDIMDRVFAMRLQRKHHAKDQHDGGHDGGGHIDVDAHDVTE